MRTKTLTKAELARRLGVSRTHITLLTQGKRKLSDKLADKLADLLVDLRADKSNAPQWTFNPLVTGSNPVRSTKNPHEMFRAVLCSLYFRLIGISGILGLGKPGPIIANTSDSAISSIR